MTRSTASARRRRSADSGTALVGTLVGFAIFLVLLLLAVQVSVRLYDTSVLTSAATHAAQEVAQSPDPAATVGQAEAEARSRLGSYGAHHTRFVWKEVDASRVVLQVVGGSPRVVPVVPGWGSITRTVTVRTERFR